MATLDDIELVDTERVRTVAVGISSMSRAARPSMGFMVGRSARTLHRADVLRRMQRVAYSLVEYSKAEKALITHELPKAIINAEVALRLRPELLNARRVFLTLAKDVEGKKQQVFGRDRELFDHLGQNCMRASKNAALMLEICDQSISAAGLPIPKELPPERMPPRMHAPKGQPRRPRPKPRR